MRALKKILLLGNSISIGYREFVKAAFLGVAEVVYPQENGRFAANLLRRLYDYKTELGLLDNVALVHWNAGLWDDLILPDGKVQTPKERYAEDIERICETLKILFPGAKYVFATSTPVIEELYPRTFEYYRRFNKDTESYNEAAKAVILQHGCGVNDLYSVMKTVPDDYHSDPTHFNTKEGARVISKAIISCIENALGIKAREVDFNELWNEKIKNEGI